MIPITTASPQIYHAGYCARDVMLRAIAAVSGGRKGNENFASSKLTAMPR